jgi:hypothetical protein
MELPKIQLTWKCTVQIMVNVKVALQRASAGTEGSRHTAVVLLGLGDSWGLVVTAIFLTLYPPGERPSAHSAGGWVGPGASLDGYGKEKCFHPHRVSNPEPFRP